MSAPLTPAAALARLRQYGERTSTWSTATYSDGTEKTLHQIALTLAAEVESLHTRVAELESQAGGYTARDMVTAIVAAGKERDRVEARRMPRDRQDEATPGDLAEQRHLLYDADPDSTVPPLVDIHRHKTTRRGNR